MNSSGIKRGMAALAIAAVAVTGAPVLTGTASAISITNDIDTALGVNEIVLYNQVGRAISTEPDGTNSTVRLECGGGSNVTSVAFEYRLNPGGATFITIGEVTSRNDDGAFSLEWAAPPVGQTIDLRCTDTTPLGTGQSDRADGIEVFGTDPNIDTINITDDSQRGYYDSDSTGCFNGINMIVNGTTSFNSTDRFDVFIQASEAGPSAANTSPGNFNNFAFSFADLIGNGTFSGFFDIGAYDFANAAGEFPDQIVTRATTNFPLPAPGVVDDTEDIEAFTLYEQVITTVTVTDDSTGNGGLPTEVTVLVVDQNGEPVAGAEVVQSGTGAVDLTDSRGEAHFSQATNLETYFADNDCSGAFQFSAGDRTAAPFQAGNTGSNITISSNPEGVRPVPSATTETVTVRNGDGSPIVNRQVRITRTGPDSTQDVSFYTTNAQGQVVFTVSCNVRGIIRVQAAFQDPSGSGTPTPSDPFNRFTTDTVQCGTPPATGDDRRRINPAIKGKNVRGGNDWVLVRAKQADGAVVKLFKVVGKNRRVLLDTGRLNNNGVYKNVFRDLNGSDLTVYKAVVGATHDTLRGVTNRLQQPKIS